MQTPRPKIARPRLSERQLSKVPDDGVRRHMLGEMRSRNTAEAIIAEYYGPLEPKLELPPKEQTGVAVSPSQDI